MHVGLDKATTERIDDLVGALDRQSTANTRLAAAVEAHTEAIWASNPVKPPKPEPCSGDCKASDRERGLYAKYRVERIDGKPVGEVFVLEPERDPFAAGALEGYAMECDTTHQPLADDLMAMAQRCRDRHESAGTVGDEGTR